MAASCGMARPVGDEHIARPGAANSGTEREPDPHDLPPTEAANAAEDAARRAVEGVGIDDTIDPPARA